MPITTIHTIGSILVSNQANTLQHKLHGITNRTLSPGLQELMQMPAGQADVDYVATMQVAPAITATCTELAVAMGAFGLAGMAIGADPNFQVDAYWTKIAQNAIRAGVTSHVRHRMAAGMVTINSLSWTHPGQATCEVALHPTWDGGSNPPLLYAGSVSLPETPAIAEAYVGGPVFINNVEIESVDAITVDLGLTVVRRYTGGLVRPVYASIQTRSPRITVTTRDITNTNTMIEGLAQGGTASEVYFRKMDKHGTRVANGTAQHIKFTILANKGEIWVGDAGGGNNEDATVPIIIQPSQMPTVSTTSTIPGSS